MPLTNRHRPRRGCRNLPSLLLCVVAMLSVAPLLARRGAWHSSPSSPILANHFTSKVAASPLWVSSLRGGGDETNAVSRDGGPRGPEAAADAEAAGTAYRTVQVHLVHRHGDRTPITPLRDEPYWASTLVPPDLLGKVTGGTVVVRPDHDGHDGTSSSSVPRRAHAASGRGPFGKLTQVGLLQMIEVGSRLRDELEGAGTAWADGSAVFASDPGSESDGVGGRARLRPEHLKVYSTDFERTVQSVQGVLVGFFPDDPSAAAVVPAVVEIDCRHTTSWMIPDPQPRRTSEQERLEAELARRPHVLEREEEMRPLAVRCSHALAPLLGNGAFDVSFGVGEEGKRDGDAAAAAAAGPGHDGGPPHRVLPWAQLAEITKCLQVRGLLPASITDEDQEAVSAHTAWRWFESLRNPRLAYLSMHVFTGTVVRGMQTRHDGPPVTLYSCHDSSLIGLLCALHLEQPSVWPEYGSVLKIELLEKRQQLRSQEDGEDPSGEKEYVVRFSLNGEALRSQWHGDLRDEISLDRLAHFVATEGAAHAERR